MKALSFICSGSHPVMLFNKRKETPEMGTPFDKDAELQHYKRAYALGLKAVPNFIFLSDDQLAFYEAHLSEIPSALDRGFGIPLADMKQQKVEPAVVVAGNSSLDTDPWAEEKKRNETFWRDTFGIFLDWGIISLPPWQTKMSRLDLNLADVTEDEVFESYVKKFGKKAAWKYWNSITASIAQQQERPKSNYAFSHVGGDEPDMLNKSYDDGIAANVKFMTPKEGLVAAFRYRVETGKMYDVKGITRFAALDHGGYAMNMFRDYDGRFRVGRGNRGYRNPSFGLRQVSF